MVERAGKSFEVWAESLKGKQSEKRYQGFLDEFLNWKGWTYEQFFLYYLEALKSSDPRDRALANTVIVNFFKEMRSRGLSSGSARNRVNAVVGFLRENGLDVNFTSAQKKEMARKPIRFKDNFSKEEIRLCLSATTSIRNKALIHALKDSGMAVSDMADLKVRDLKAALDNGDKFAQVEYVRNKTGEHGEPCFGYESLEAIREWMRWRRSNGFNCSPETPLFILVEVDEAANYNRTREEILSGVRMSGTDMTSIIRYIIARAGITDKKLSAHCFRVFNESQLESAGCNKNVVYRLQARQIPDSGKVYSKGEVLTSYMKNYRALALEVEPQIIEVEKKDPRMDVLEDQVKKLMETVEAERRGRNQMMDAMESIAASPELYQKWSESMKKRVGPFKPSS